MGIDVAILDDLPTALRVLGLIAEGRSYDQICLEMEISYIELFGAVRCALNHLQVTETADVSKTSETPIGRSRRKHPRAYEPWSLEEDARLRILWNDGESVRSIAHLFGRQEGAIRSRLDKLGIVRRGTSTDV